MRTLLKEDMEVSHSQTTHLDLFSLPPPWNLELGGFPKQQSITQLFPLLTSIVRMDQPWTLLLPFEVNALRSRPLSCKNTKSSLSNVDDTDDFFLLRVAVHSRTSIGDTAKAGTKSSSARTPQAHIGTSISIS